MGTKLLEVLRSGRVLLMDGAMGTELQRAGIQPGECYERWNLTHPERVLAIHRAYTEAGAEVLLTNTFQANPSALAKHRLDQQFHQLCHAGVHLARRAASSGSFVLGDLTPFEGRQRLDLRESFLELLTGADGLMLETCTDLMASERFAFDLLTAQFKPGQRELPIFQSFAFHRTTAGELRTIDAFTPEDVARGRGPCSIDALGVNCGRDISMADIIEIVRRYRTVTDLPIFARPNAGTPTQVNGQWLYPHSPEQMAAKLPELLEAGVAMVGGCCGTTPAHIAAFRPIVDAWNARNAGKPARLASARPLM